MIFQPSAGIRNTLKNEVIMDKVESNIAIALKKTGEGFFLKKKRTKEKDNLNNN